MGDLEYAGQELDLFASARRWKTYWGSQLRPYVRGRVLDIGAGIGSTIDVLYGDHLDEWTALEPDKSLRDRLETGVRRAGRRRIAIVPGTLDDLSSTEKFDTILYIDVLEHIEHDRSQLRSAAEHLAPNGRIVVLSPAHQWLFTAFDTAIGHYRRYTRRTLSEAVPETLEIDRIFYLDSVGMLASLGNKLFLKSGAPTAAQIAFWNNWMVPVSRFVDPMTGYSLGKTVVGVFRATQNTKDR